MSGENRTVCLRPFDFYVLKNYICPRCGDLSLRGRVSWFLPFPHMSEKHFISQEGLDKLRKDLEAAVAQRPVISAAIAEAREKGDLSENAEYDAAREAQGRLELKIARLREQISAAVVVNKANLNTDTVQFLNKVKFQNLSNNLVMEFTIVGEKEADLASGKLADTTPIGKALMGHKKGEVVEAATPAGTIKLKILDISL